MKDILEIIRKIIKKEASLRRVAREIGVERSSLHFSLKEGANPTLKTITKVLHYLGYELRIVKSKKRKGVRK
jgi:probable addiction module antidote protein